MLSDEYKQAQENKNVAMRKMMENIKPQRHKGMTYYSDDTQINGYRAIRNSRDEDDIIWVDCDKELIPVIVNALNAHERGAE